MPIKDAEAIRVVRKALSFIDPRLVDHGDRVAFVIHEMLVEDDLFDEYDWRNLFILSSLHDIGAYKTEEIDCMLQFETIDVWSHAIYGYLFLRDMTIMGDYATAILFHHASNKRLEEADIPFRDYAALINLADRIDVRVGVEGAELDTSFLEDEDGFFNERFVDLFMRANENRGIVKRLAAGDIDDVVETAFAAIAIPEVQVFDYLNVLVNSIDFRSPHTVTHTRTTMAVAMELAKHLGLGKRTVEVESNAALIHDIGKIAMPADILEFPGKLSPEKMKIMRSHVAIGEQITREMVSDEIFNIAMRHHEKLDGSGYPRGLTGADLDLPQRVLAIADIVSALTGRRSYKDPFPKEKTIAIILDMSASGQLCPRCCQTLAEHYDEIMETTDRMTKPIVELYSRLQAEYARMRSLTNQYGDEAIPLLL